MWLPDNKLTKKNLELILQTRTDDTLILETLTPHSFDLADDVEDFEIFDNSGIQVEIQEKVAEGGMSYIYLGWQESLGRRVAVKMSKNKDRSFQKILCDEAVIIGQLEHPNIPPIYDIVGADVILKWLEGETLRQKLEEWQEWGLEIDFSIPVLLDICNALEYAHSRGVIHRDIKTDNIMICDYGAIYLLDWGIALKLDDRDKNSASYAERHNSLVGTLGYMAPEMSTENPVFTVDERTDIYLMGATLHEVLVGLPRHWSEVISDIPSLIEESLPFEYDEEIYMFGQVCNKACAREKEDRYQSIKEFTQALKSAFEIWKQRSLLDQGCAMLEELELLEGGRLSLSGENGDIDATNHIHAFQLYMQIRAAFDGYLFHEPNNEIAIEGLQKASQVLMAYFLKKKQLQSAQFMKMIIGNVPRRLLDTLEALEEEDSKKTHILRNYRLMEFQFGILIVFLVIAVIYLYFQS